MVCTGSSSRTGRKSWLTSPTVQAPTSPGDSRVTRWASSWRAATDREGEFERFGDEGTSVRQEDVLELQGDQAQRGGPRDLLQDAATQAEARMNLELAIESTIPGSPRNRRFRGVEAQAKAGLKD